jgi:hypothetical protein
MAGAQQVRETLDAIRAERARGRTIRLATTGAVVAVVLIFVGSLYSKVKAFDVDGTVVAMQAHGQRTILPVYSTRLAAVGHDAVPALSDALRAEAEALLPRISERLTTEASVFQERIASHMKASLDRDFRAAIEARNDDFKKRFPAFAANEQVYEDLMLRLQTASQDWAQHRLDTTFVRHIALLQSINETVQGLQADAAAERAPGADGPVMEDALVLMAEILNARVGGGE